MYYQSPEANILKNTGSFGSVLVTTTDLYVGSYFAIQAVDDCTFLTLSSTNMENVSDWVTKNITLNAGSVIHANFTTVSLSGIAILYKH